VRTDEATTTESEELTSARSQLDENVENLLEIRRALI